MSPKNSNGNNNGQVLDPQRDAKLVSQVFASETLETLMTKDLYLIDFNISCRTREGVYIPIEVGVVKFSIKDGVKDFFHDFIDPGIIPLGYGATARDLSENYHGIPLNRFASKNYNKFSEFIQETSRTDEENYKSSINEACRRIDRFVQPETVIREAEGDRPRSSVRPIFSLRPEGVTQTEGCLRRLGMETDNISFYESFQVMDIVHMLKFCCRLSDEKADRAYAIFDNALSIKVLDPPSKRCCKYHFEIDNYKCAIGRAFAMTYCFLDHVCPHYPVVPTAEHLPPALEPLKEDPEWQAQLTYKFSQSYY